VGGLIYGLPGRLKLVRLYLYRYLGGGGLGECMRFLEKARRRCTSKLTIYTDRGHGIYGL